MTAWIIGAAGGIGQAAVETLAQSKNTLCLFDKKEARSEFHNRNYYQVDFSKYEIAREKCMLAVEECGRPQILCFAAGEVISQSFENTTDDIVDSLYQNNFKALLHALKIFIENCDMSAECEKSIIIISSNAGSVARVNQPIYAAFKAAINSLIKSLAKDYGKYNLRINGVAPGTVIVDRNIDSLRIKFPEFPFDRKRPLQKLMYPTNLTPVINFLLDERCPITGQIITIDGGSTL